MTSDEFIMTIGIVTGIAGVYAVRAGQALYAKVMLEYQYMKHPRVIAFDPNKICDEDTPHDWKNLAMAVRDLPYGMYKVCLTCGMIHGNKLVMVSAEVLEHAREALKLKAIQDKATNEAAERITAITNAEVGRYISSNFPPASMPELAALSRYTLKAYADAAEKVAAELAHRADLDKRYEGWESKVKGRA
jgi:hypothetical protein